MIVTLTHPLTVAEKILNVIEVRSPGRNVFNSMKEAGAGEFDRAAICRFAGRLSGYSARTIDSLTDADFDAVRSAVVSEYQAAARRLGSRKIKQSAWGR